MPRARPSSASARADRQGDRAEIAHGLGKRTVAEFVGDEQTLRLLGRYGVDFTQDYYTGKPLAVGQTWPPTNPEHVPSAPLE